MSNMERLMAQAKSAKKPSSTATKPAAALFGEDDENDDHLLPPGNLAGPSKRPTAKPSTGAGPSKPNLGRTAQKQQAEALKLDASVFDYDGVYDSLKAAERKRDEAKKMESDERKPKYIEAFLASAQTRRLDKLRAEEKMLQLERDKEGDEFADKDKFVTDAYKRQMEEVRKAEQEEKERDGELSDAPCWVWDPLLIRIEALRKSKKGPGLSAFYKQMLDTSSAEHDAAVAASSNATAGPSLAIKPPQQDNFVDEAEYDPLLAREERSKPNLSAGTTGIYAESGKEVDVNDEGEVVDKRSLLKAGLNIMKKPKPVLPNSLLSGQRSTEVLEGPYQSRAVGAAAGYQERMDRERKRLATQIKEEAERKKAEHEERMKAEEEAARKRREGDDGEAERRRKEARDRFLARKRAREEAGPTDDNEDSEPKKAK